MSFKENLKNIVRPQSCQLSSEELSKLRDELVSRLIQHANNPEVRKRAYEESRQQRISLGENKDIQFTI